MGIKSKINKFLRLKRVSRKFLSDGAFRVVSFYEKSSASLDEKSVELVCRELRILSHTIEKGLSLPKVRHGFGKEKVHQMLYFLEQYVKIGDFNFDNEAFVDAIAILHRYVAEATKFNFDISFIDLNKYEKYFNGNIKQYGVIPLVDEDRTKMSFEEIAYNRHSIRGFDEKELPTEKVKMAVELAQTGPSACNRQSVRVIHVKDKECCRQILEIQGGAKGHSNSEILLVVSDLSLYRYTSELNIPYLDGGIFLMNLLYSLTYYGIGSCPLIWDDYGDMGVEVRKIINLLPHMHVIAVVQIGYPLKQAKFAISKRRSIDSVYFSGDELKNGVNYKA